MDNLFKCCRGDALDNHAQQSELLVDLSTDVLDHPQMRHHIQHPCSHDIGFAPRATSALRPVNGAEMPTTLSAQHFRDTIELPVLQKYPLPPNCSPDEPYENRVEILRTFFQEFAVELFTGVTLTQLTAGNLHCQSHCQLLSDGETLKLDQSNGHIVEFPLAGVCKVYRVAKSNDRFFSGEITPAGGRRIEHIIVLDYMRRKLAFVFDEVQIAQRFFICMELLVRRAQQLQNAAGQPGTKCGETLGCKYGCGNDTWNAAPLVSSRTDL
mmetsp:Transcript_33411/g.92299  ORF Transcript_33411/g.92299 Transcript_33411/m.92299 type:complete len:268 (-) Transcript_33411:85-888(-)